MRYGFDNLSGIIKTIEGWHQVNALYKRPHLFNQFYRNFYPFRGRIFRPACVDAGKDWFGDGNPGNFIMQESGVPVADQRQNANQDGRQHIDFFALPVLGSTERLRVKNGLRKDKVGSGFQFAAQILNLLGRVDRATG